jgi:hypothetical protein
MYIKWKITEATKARYLRSSDRFRSEFRTENEDVVRSVTADSRISMFSMDGRIWKGAIIVGRSSIEEAVELSEDQHSIAWNHCIL